MTIKGLYADLYEPIKGKKLVWMLKMVYQDHSKLHRTTKKNNGLD